MRLLERLYRASKHTAICAVAIVLLLNPACGEFCHGQSCSLVKAEIAKPSCHESPGLAGRPGADALRATRICGSRQAPAVLPVGSRSFEQIRPIKSARATLRGAVNVTEGFSIEAKSKS